MWKISVLITVSAVNLLGCPKEEVQNSEGEAAVVEKTETQKVDELSKRLDWTTAVLVKGSESKSGVGLYNVNVKLAGGGTSSGAVTVLKHSEKAQALAIVPTVFQDFQKKGAEKTLQVKWNPSGTKVAIHDASAKHSICQIYYLTPESRFERAKLPDDPRWMAARAGVKDSQKVISSGREPINWDEEKQMLLWVEFRFRTDDKVNHRKKFFLLIDDKGVYHVQ